MTVSITRRKNLPDIDVGLLRRRAVRLLKLCHVSDKELSILLTDDREMHTLNHTYRNRDRTTDVLSFSQQEGNQPWAHPGLLGDVVISVPTAVRQAHKNAHPLMHEIIHLLIHGVLHLLGYDHENVPSSEIEKMQKEHKRLQASLNPDHQPG